MNKLIVISAVTVTLGVLLVLRLRTREAVIDGQTAAPVRLADGQPSRPAAPTVLSPLAADQQRAAVETGEGVPPKAAQSEPKPEAVAVPPPRTAPVKAPATPIEEPRASPKSERERLDGYARKYENLDANTRRALLSDMNSTLDWSESALPDETGRLTPAEFDLLLEEVVWLKAHLD